MFLTGVLPVCDPERGTWNPERGPDRMLRSAGGRTPYRKLAEPRRLRQPFRFHQPVRARRRRLPPL